MKADLCGELVTSSYTNKEGNNVKRTVVNVDKIQFGESRASYERAEQQSSEQPEETHEEAHASVAEKEPPKEDPKPVTTKADDTQSLLDEAGDAFMDIPDDISSDEAPFM